MYCSLKGTHEIAEANENKNAKMRNAFGIKNDFPEGSSFKEEHQKAKKEEEKAEREERYKEKQAKRCVSTSLSSTPGIKNIGKLEKM